MKSPRQDQTTSGTFVIPLVPQGFSWFRDLQAQRNGSWKIQHKSVELRYLFSFRDVLWLWDKWGQESSGLSRKKAPELHQGTRMLPSLVKVITICWLNSPDCDKFRGRGDETGLVPAVEKCTERYTRSVSKCKHRVLGITSTDWEYPSHHPTPPWKWWSQISHNSFKGECSFTQKEMNS